MTNLEIISLIAGLMALYCAIEIYKHLRNEIFQLNDSVFELDERVKKMEEAGQKRINYRSLEEIEHAMSEMMMLRMDKQTEIDRIDNIMGHMSKAHTPKQKT